MENPSKMDDLGGFPPIFGNIHEKPRRGPPWHQRHWPSHQRWPFLETQDFAQELWCFGIRITELELHLYRIGTPCGQPFSNWLFQLDD